MKKRIFQVLCLIFFICIFASCDPEVKATYYLENKSGHIVYANPGATIFTIHPNEVAIIGMYQHIGDREPGWVVYDSIRIYTDADTYKKIPSIDSNWIKTNPKRYAYEYRFVVEDKDF